MKIKLNSIPVGIHEIALSKDVRDFGLQAPFFGDADVKVKVDRSEHQIVLSCKFVTQLLLNCDRCLAEYEQKVSGDFTVIYLAERIDEDIDDTNVYELTPDLTYIDLTKDFYDFINLSVPLKHICSEDCKGLCPTCGANLNIETCDCESEKVNPIWEPLLKLKKDLND